MQLPKWCVPVAALVLALSAAPSASANQRERLRQQLAAAPGQWVTVPDRWVPLRAGAKGLEAMKERGRFRVGRLGCALVVRCYTPQKRNGQQGFVVRQMVKSIDAASPRRAQQEVALSGQALGRLLELAQDKFIERPQLTRLHRSAMSAMADCREVDKVSLMRAAMDGAAKSLGCRWTKFVPAEEAARDRAKAKSKRSGCPIKLKRSDGRVLLAGFYNDAVASSLGLCRDDRLCAVDGQPVRTLNQARSSLLGAAGTRAALELERSGERFRTTVAREAYRAYEVTGSVREGYAVVKLPKFYKGCAGEVKKTLSRLEREGGQLKGLVLDLRGNPGGLRKEWLSLVNQFVPDGGLGHHERQGSTPGKSYTADGSCSRPQLPMRVLVNAKTASASERVAGVLQARGRAQLIGQPTYGKDVGQTLYDLPDGSRFRVTSIRFQLPGQTSRAGVIRPDISSTQAQQRVRRALGRQARDPELTAALLDLGMPAAGLAVDHDWGL